MPTKQEARPQRIRAGVCHGEGHVDPRTCQVAPRSGRTGHDMGSGGACPPEGPPDGHM
jgi:hypothetical protein